MKKTVTVSDLSGLVLDKEEHVQVTFKWRDEVFHLDAGYNELAELIEKAQRRTKRRKRTK